MKAYLDVVQQASELHKNEQWLEAATLYEHLLGNQPDDPVILYLYGTLCSQTKHFGTAITFLQKSLALEPVQLPDAWHNLGVALRSEGHTKESREAYKRCLQLKPDDPNTLAMIAGSYVNTGEPGLAIDYARRAIAIEDNPHAENHLALGLLELGRYSEAWPHYMRRYDLVQMQARPYTCPQWDGKTKVKKLAIHGEQGLGDEIMYMSCFDELKHLADEIVIECADRLVVYFQASFGVPCYATHDELIQAHPDVDAFIQMGNLPTFVRQTSADFPGTPYMRADETTREDHRHKLEKFGGAPYVGIAWHGGTKATHQEVRNPPIDGYKAVIDQIRALGGTPISIQYGEDAAGQALELGIPHWQYAIDDLASQAALISVLDLVISPCQTAIHIAGALGVECWCLTPSAPAWRYKVKGPMDWYQSVQLIRQKGTNWDTVFKTVAEQLDANYGNLQTAQSATA